MPHTTSITIISTRSSHTKVQKHQLTIRTLPGNPANEICFSGLSSFTFTSGIESPTFACAAARMDAAAECAAWVAEAMMEAIGWILLLFILRLVGLECYEHDDDGS
jgi:hypothetical protein